MLDNMTYGAYLFFVMFMLMGIALVIWVLPATFRKSLEGMVTDLSAVGSRLGSGEDQADMVRMERILMSLTWENGEEKQPRSVDGPKKEAAFKFHPLSPGLNAATTPNACGIEVGVQNARQERLGYGGRAQAGMKEHGTIGPGETVRRAGRGQAAVRREGRVREGGRKPEGS
ncbi:hypothetical protein B0H16DRAFT_1689306 [Mycena metata]|uniref:Uncharacterized protein n=1 Tax=Mycena metata TaxID=1033252 RepID=A0AAD7NFZ2_9AGAR|nr:hypothetical protein B0H16DRAFT_1689306 [Mycena metata]